MYSPLKDNIWPADLADMQLISKYNKGVRFLLCVIDIFSKYAWVVPLKGKKGVSIFNAFQKRLVRANLITKADFDTQLKKKLATELPEIKKKASVC